MTVAWWTPVWVPAAAEPYPPDPEEPDTDIDYDPWEPAVIQTADWTCSCASSAWLLNSLGDDRLGRPWNEFDVVDALRAATYYGAVSPDYGLARADMYDLETMFRALGYDVLRKQYLSRADILAWSGRYPLQMNGARWYHHTGARTVGPGVIYLANPAPSWKNVGQELDADEASSWGSWNGLVVVGRI
jgi:hypothetical protein